MNDTSILKRFESISPGMTYEEVLGIMGEPTFREQSHIPHDSGWGEQPAMWIKIPACKPFLRLSYDTVEGEFAIWFAKVQEQWRIALKLRVPSNISLFK